MSEPKNGLLTMEEAAAELGVNYYTISRWLNLPKGQRLDCIRRGERYVRLTVDHIEEFKTRLDSGKVPSPTRKRTRKPDGRLV